MYMSNNIARIDKILVFCSTRRTVEAKYRVRIGTCNLNVFITAVKCGRVRSRRAAHRDRFPRFKNIMKPLNSETK